jgi:acetyltransferase
MSILTTAPPEEMRDFLHPAYSALEAMFTPTTVALIGATERHGSIGRTLLENLSAHPFGGAVYPVNPRHRSLLGQRTFARVGEIPATVDLAVIAIPARAVPGVVAECRQAGVRGAVILSAGFAETGEAGKALETQIVTEAHLGGMRIIGPNCLGIMLPHTGLNATFATGMAQTGRVAFISQSGALCTAVLDWSLQKKVGFSAFLSIGSMADVQWGDLIAHLANDPHTQSIVLYMESIGDPGRFLAAARAVAPSKPIVVLKVGRTPQAARAAASHTGALTGSDAVLDAAFRRAGVLRVNTIAELFAVTELLAKQPRPRGPRLAIVTNAGGPAALATDLLVRTGGQIAELSPASTQALALLLPEHGSGRDPVDLLGDADAERYARALEIVTRDPGADGVLAILTPQAMTQSTATADRLISTPNPEGKPMMASWMGGQAVADGIDLLNTAQIPTFEFPDAAARAFAALWQYRHSLGAVEKCPPPLPARSRAETAKTAHLLDHVRRSGRTLLTEIESKALLSTCGLPSVETRLAATEEEAAEWAEALDGPVVLKLHSETISHKSAADGVKLGLLGEEAVRRAFREIEESVRAAEGPPAFLGVTVQPMIPVEGADLILGASSDPQFGPVILFGAGGGLVEFIEDRALGLPPLDSAEARRLMAQTRIYKALADDPATAALETWLIGISQLVMEHRCIKEMDVNPLRRQGEHYLALDARVILHGPDIPEQSLPPLPLRPYPTRHVRHVRLQDGVSLLLRPVSPDDEPLLLAFHQSLAQPANHPLPTAPSHLPERVVRERIRRICWSDSTLEITLVTEHRRGQKTEILGIARLSRSTANAVAALTLLVAPEWRGRGIGTRLLAHVVDVARQEDISQISARIEVEDMPMVALLRRAGFGISQEADFWEATLSP